MSSGTAPPCANVYCTDGWEYLPSGDVVACRRCARPEPSPTINAKRAKAGASRLAPLTPDPELVDACPAKHTDGRRCRLPRGHGGPHRIEALAVKDRASGCTCYYKGTEVQVCEMCATAGLGVTIGPCGCREYGYVCAQCQESRRAALPVPPGPSRGIALRGL